MFRRVPPIPTLVAGGTRPPAPPRGIAAAVTPPSSCRATRLDQFAGPVGPSAFAGCSAAAGPASKPERRDKKGRRDVRGPSQTAATGPGPGFSAVESWNADDGGVTVRFAVAVAFST